MENQRMLSTQEAVIAEATTPIRSANWPGLPCRPVWSDRAGLHGNSAGSALLLLQSQQLHMGCQYSMPRSRHAVNPRAAISPP